MKLELPLNWRFGIALSLLSVVCAGAHEMAHHFTSAAVCGSFGRMSFGLFASSDACAFALPGEAAGPMFTYLFAMLGAWFIVRGERPLLGYGMVVASHSWLRMISIVAGAGDEAIISQALTGENHRLLVAGIATALTLPPLVIAYRALANRRRPMLFAASLLLPFFAALLPMKWIDDRLFAANVHSPETFHGMLVVGIPSVVLATFVVAAALFAGFGWKQFQEPSLRNRRQAPKARIVSRPVAP